MKDELRTAESQAEISSVPSPESLPRYVDRDLSWLEFNRRVLHEALDPRTPLLERLQFLNIFTSNLDEFLMKRIGAVMHRQSEKDAQPHADSEPLVQRLKAIHDTVAPMLNDRAKCLRKQILPQLHERGIQLLDWNDLTDHEREQANSHFQNNVFPVLTPQSVDHSHPFPFMSNLSVSLAIRLKNPFTEERLFARVKVPKLLPQWIELEAKPDGVRRFIDLRTIIFHNLSFLFPGMTIQNVMTLRITRSAEIDYDDDDSDDLLELVTEEVRQRRLQRVVRIEHSPTDDRWLLDTVVEQLQLPPEQVYEMPDNYDYVDFSQIASLDIPELRYPPWSPTVPTPLADDDADIFALIRAGDVMVHHPYESFDASVSRFVRAAVEDENVLAIKMAVYRTSEHSPFLPLYF